MGWNTVNMVTSIGSFVFAAGVLMFLADLVWSYKRGPVAGNNPWDAPTLEWSVSSPPPPYNFATIPVVESGHPLWEERIFQDKPSQRRTQLDEGMILDHGREALATRALDGRPDAILKMPGDSYAPFLLGLFSTLIFTAMLLHVWWLALVMLAGFAASLTAWMWPERALGQREPPGDALG